MYGFEGWLLKINGFDMTPYIHAGSYKATPNQRTDLDDYTDNDGVFHRNELPAKATKIEFDLKPMHLIDKVKVQGAFGSSRSEVSVEYWNDETNQYQTGRMYIPDITFEPYMVYREDQDILYNPTRIAVIEYGEVR